jgi:adenine phosphoribosyltransferase
MEPEAEALVALIRDVPDFPRPGILFRDITPLLGDPTSFRLATELMVAPFRDAPEAARITRVVAVEARGFILGGPVAQALGAGLVPVRKPGKLPWATHAHSYELEYGTDGLEVHRDALVRGDRVLIVDDVLATGGTAEAACELVARSSGATIVAVSVLLELNGLGGRARVEASGVPVIAVVDV